MARFRVTAREVRRTAENLRSQNRYFNSQVNSLQNSERRLHGMWEGQAHDAFHNAFMHDKDYMARFHQLIEQYCRALDEIARQYEEAERRNLHTARERKVR